MTIGVGQHAVLALTSNSTTIGPTAGVTTQSSGSRFVVVVFHENSATVSSVTDNKGNTYTRQGSVNSGGAFASFASEWWLSGSTSSGGSGHTFQAAQSPTNLGLIMMIEITSAGSVVLHVDGGWSAVGPATTITKSITTTVANCVLVAALGTGSIGGTETLTWNGTDVFTALDAAGNANFFTGGSAKFTAAAAAAYTASVATSGASSNGANIMAAAFVESGGAAAPAALIMGNPTLVL